MKEFEILSISISGFNRQLFFSNPEFYYSLEVSGYTTDRAYLDELGKILENMEFPIPPAIEKKVGKFKIVITYENPEKKVSDAWDLDDFIWDVVDQIMRTGWLPYSFKDGNGTIYFRRFPDHGSKNDSPKLFDIDLADDDDVEEDQDDNSNDDQDDDPSDDRDEDDY